MISLSFPNKGGPKVITTNIKAKIFKTQPPSPSPSPEPFASATYPEP